MVIILYFYIKPLALRASTWKKVFFDALKLHVVQRDQLIPVDLEFDKVGLRSNVSVFCPFTSSPVECPLYERYRV